MSGGGDDENRGLPFEPADVPIVPREVPRRRYPGAERRGVGVRGRPRGPAAGSDGEEVEPGPLITFEGIDGSGKSTQARLLADALRAQGRDVVLTREPGGSEGAEAIRGLLLTGDHGRWSPVTEALLFTAARNDHVERVVRPAVADGKTVICDRYVDSTRVYQGGPGGEMRALVDALHRDAVGREPDLTLILDVDPEKGLARAEDPNRFEGIGLAFQKALREGFLALAEEFPERCRVIDGSGPVEAVAARVLEAVP